MEPLETRLQVEANRREVYERKSAELERINDELRLENRLLIAQVQSLNSKLEALQTLSLGTDDSDDDGDDDDEDEVLDDDHYVKLESLSSSNSPTKAAAKDENKSTNSSSGVPSNSVKRKISASNGQSKSPKKASTTNMEIKVQTLRRKKKKLQAELQHQSLSYQDAFQEELDLRAKLEEKLERFKVHYEKIVEENDHMREVLANHCINVPHKLARKRRSTRRDVKSPGKPPSFIPPGRSKTTSQAPPTDASCPSPSAKSGTTSPQAVSDKNEPVTTEPAGDNSRPGPSQDGAEGASEQSDQLSEEPGGAEETQTSGNLSRRSSVSSLNSSEVCEQLEHIVVAEAGIQQPEVMPVIQVIDDSLMVTSDEIENARSFYELMRRRAKSDSDSN